MSTYIKIRELNPYPTPTGVFTGDMFACALDDTTPGTPHSSQGTQKATVKQVLESYNTMVAREQSLTPGEQPGVIFDADGNIIDGGPPLSAATFNDYIKLGGGLEFEKTCTTLPDGNQKCTYELAIASSSDSINFNLVCSGGSTDTEYSIRPNGWISGRFPTLKAATDWVNWNIGTAKSINFLIANDLTENWVNGGHYNISSETLEAIAFLNYGYYALTYDQNTNMPANGDEQWSQAYAAAQGYKKNNIVQYTGQDDGTLGNYNLYRAKQDGVTQLPTDTNDWDPMVPSMATGLTAYDPNGFSSEGFTSRPNITFNHNQTNPNPNAIPAWYSHGGSTSFIGLKLTWNNLNAVTDTPDNHWHWAHLYRKDGNFMNWASSELHLNGMGIYNVFQAINRSTIRVTDNMSNSLFSIPDPYHVTGAAGEYCPCPGLYISLSGLTGARYAGTGVGSVFQVQSSSEALVGLEYWAHSTRNKDYSQCRIQFGSGVQRMTAMVEAREAGIIGGNVGIQASPSTTFQPGGCGLDLTGYGPGLGRKTAEEVYPYIAPIAARQFISVNVEHHWRSGHRGGTPGSTFETVKWPGNIASVASGDAFCSSKWDGIPEGTMDGDILGRYIRYPD